MKGRINAMEHTDKLRKSEIDLYSSQEPNSLTTKTNRKLKTRKDPVAIMNARHEQIAKKRGK